jgi:hypothetical protein
MTLRHNGSSDDGERRDAGALEAAIYLVEAITNLALIARRHRLDMLGYLLDMAHMEASEIVRLRQNQGQGQRGSEI